MDKLEPYIRAFMGASDRTRSIYLIILAFSGVSIAACLNSAEFGWSQSDLRKSRLMYAYFEFLTDTLRSHPYTLTEEQEDTARAYIGFRGVNTLEQAKIALNAAEKQAADRTLIQIPLFGLSFHINDLGLVVGSALLLLLGLLKYAITREAENLELAVSKARVLRIARDAYEILSTGEVLHRPGLLEGKKQSIFHRPLIDASVVILFVPILTYSLITANDARTCSTDEFYSPAYTMFILWFERIALGIMILLAFSCYAIVRETRGLWEELRKDAGTEVGVVNANHVEVPDETMGMQSTAADKCD